MNTGSEGAAGPSGPERVEGAGGATAPRDDGQGVPKLPAVRAVLFDLDGVLIDSYEAWYHVVNETARSFGLAAVSRGKFRTTWGQGIDADLQNLFSGRTRAAVETAFDRGIRSRSSAIHVNPEARSTLDALRRAGVRTACVTNTQESLGLALVTACGLLPLLDTFMAVRAGRREKPAPDLLLAALSSIAVPASAALMVGDSRFDAQAAMTSHVRFLNYDFRAGTSLRTAVGTAINFAL
jgi:phosphoglycolate phosphatase